jgi:hypothetical protein
VRHKQNPGNIASQFETLKEIDSPYPIGGFTGPVARIVRCWQADRGHREPVIQLPHRAAVPREYLGDGRDWSRIVNNLLAKRMVFKIKVKNRLEFRRFELGIGC